MNVDASSMVIVIVAASGFRKEIFADRFIA